MADTRYVGFKEEAQFGVAQAAPMTYDLVDGVDSMELEPPDDPNIAIPTVGRFQGKHVPGFYAPSGPLNYTIDINTIGWFLKWALGGYEFTEGAAEAPNVHEFYAQPGYTLKSATFRVGKDTFEHIFAGATINKFNLDIENELANMKIDILSQKDSKGSLRDPLVKPDPDLFPIAFYNAQTKIDGTDISPSVASWGLEFDNGIKAEDGQGQNSRFPYLFRAGTGNVGITLKKNYEDTSESLEKFWGNATGAANTNHTPFGVEEIFNSGAFGTMVTKAPRCYYTKPSTSIKGSEPRKPELAIKPEATDITLADGTTIVNSPILITLSNYEDEYVLA